MKLRKIVFTLLNLYFLSGILHGQNIVKEEQVFSIQQLRDDLIYLRKNLEDKHPNLYLYTSKPLMDRAFDSLAETISGPMTEAQFYRHVTIISSIIKDGHTIILPGNKRLAFHAQNSKFLPYSFNISETRLIVDMVCTTEDMILAGDEIISINNEPASTLIHDLSVRQVRDGENQTYPKWILNNYFRSYYHFSFGYPERFIIQYKHGDAIRSTELPALPNDSIYFYKKTKYPQRLDEKKPNGGIVLNFATDKSYALLTIKDLHNDNLKNDYQQNAKKVFADYFQQIRDSQVSNLIIDLRNNQGGDITNGTDLVKYLLDKPFTMVQSYFKVDNSQDGIRLKKTTGESMGIHEPYQNVFRGRLYVLTNGGSFSNSGAIASCLKRYKRAIFYGEETGGNEKVFAGYSKTVNLPNTGIQIEIPTKQFLLDDAMPLTGHGVYPDYLVTQALWNSLQKEDLALNLIVGEIIKDRKK